MDNVGDLTVGVKEYMRLSGDTQTLRLLRSDNGEGYTYFETHLLTSNLSNKSSKKS